LGIVVVIPAPFAVLDPVQGAGRLGLEALVEVILTDGLPQTDVDIAPRWSRRSLMNRRRV
jgi:hypothetical protein